MPNWTEHLRPRLARLSLTPEREREIVEELSHHLDERYDELRSLGTDETEALRLAIEELLDLDAFRNNMQPLLQANVPEPITPGAPKGSIIGDLWQDLRYAARILRKQSSFAAVAILTLALGIGANSSIFALVDATLLRPLPFSEPNRLVMLWERSASSTHGYVAPLNLRDWDERNHTFDRIAACIPEAGGMVMAGADGTSETVSRQWVTSGFFEVLGVKAIAGRTFLPTDDSRRTNAVVLSEGIWRTRFNADPRVVGRDIPLDGTPYTVVGVVPKEFQLFGRTSLWALLSIDGAPPAARGVYAFQAFGRLKRGVTQKAAEADIAAVAEGLAREYPKTNTGRGVTMEPLDGALIGSEVRTTAMLFLGVVAFVLLICCANVANLLLARGTARRRELAIRAALGAGRQRIVRQVLTESVLLSIAGGVAGLAVGAAILNVAPSLIPEGLLPSAVTLTFDWRVVVFCGATTLLVGALFGIAPAWQAIQFSTPQMMSSESRTVTGGGRIRGLLVVGEVATAALLLFGAGLLLHTLIKVDHVDRGYGARSILTMMVDPLASRYPTGPALMQFYEAVDHEIRTIPGADSTAWASTLPLGTSSAGPSFFEIAGEPVEESKRPTADYQIVSPSYFGTIDVPVIAGRGFDAHDTPDSVVVCIVNEAFVRRHLQGRSPIGVRIVTRPAGSAQAKPVVREIVGVVRQVKGQPDETEDLVQIYVPLAQNTMDDIFVLVRPASGRAEALASSVRAAIARVDKEQLVSVRDVMTLEDVAWEATARHRFRAVLVMTFAGLALLLAMVGVFGILAYSVHQRMRDFAVRRALGATSADVLRLVGAWTVRVIVAGAAIGFALSSVLGSLLSTMLFGVEPLDPITFAAVTVVLTITAALSAVGPAWRAVRIDPASTLRGE
jgi:putative ABC transport system permease protein